MKKVAILKQIIVSAQSVVLLNTFETLFFS